MASFDLGALLKGLSGGMGKYADIQFAERLQREAEQRKIAAEERALERQRLLAGEAFDRQKQLQEIIANRGVESEQRTLMDELQRALGTARGMDMPGMGALDNEKLRGLIPREDMNALIGELTGASQLKAGAEAEGKAAYDPENVLKMKKLESDIAANEALVGARNRSNRGGGGGGVVASGADLLTPKQRIDLYMKEVESLQDQKNAEIRALRSNVVLASDPEELAAQIAAVEESYSDIHGMAKANVEAYLSMAFGGETGGGEEPPPGGGDVPDYETMYNQEAGKGKGQLPPIKVAPKYKEPQKPVSIGKDGDPLQGVRDLDWAKVRGLVDKVFIPPEPGEDPFAGLRRGSREPSPAREELEAVLQSSEQAPSRGPRVVKPDWRGQGRVTGDWLGDAIDEIVGGLGNLYKSDVGPGPGPIESNIPEDRVREMIRGTSTDVDQIRELLKSMVAGAVRAYAGNQAGPSPGGMGGDSGITEEQAVEMIRQIDFASPDDLREMFSSIQQAPYRAADWMAEQLR